MTKFVPKHLFQLRTGRSGQCPVHSGNFTYVRGAYLEMLGIYKMIYQFSISTVVVQWHSVGLVTDTLRVRAFRKHFLYFFIFSNFKRPISLFRENSGSIAHPKILHIWLKNAPISIRSVCTHVLTFLFYLVK